MNDHDSEKVAGLLLFRVAINRWRHRKAASMILYNTCSIREKARAKSFSSRLGEFREKQNEGKVIGVSGVRGAAGRRKIFSKRAPWVSLVCGFSKLQQTAGNV